jgi:hypothetical protein
MPDRRWLRYLWFRPPSDEEAGASGRTDSAPRIRVRTVAVGIVILLVAAVFAWLVIRQMWR